MDHGSGCALENLPAFEFVLEHAHIGHPPMLSPPPLPPVCDWDTLKFDADVAIVECQTAAAEASSAATEARKACKRAQSAVELCVERCKKTLWATERLDVAVKENRDAAVAFARWKSEQLAAQQVCRIVNEQQGRRHAADTNAQVTKKLKPSLPSSPRRSSACRLADQQGTAVTRAGKATPSQATQPVIPLVVTSTAPDAIACVASKGRSRRNVKATAVPMPAVEGGDQLTFTQMAVEWGMTLADSGTKPRHFCVGQIAWPGPVATRADVVTPPSNYLMNKD